MLPNLTSITPIIKINMGVAPVLSISKSSILPDLLLVAGPPTQDNNVLKYLTVLALSVFALFLLRLNFVKGKNSGLYKIPTAPGCYPLIGHLFFMCLAKDIMTAFGALASQFPKYFRVKIGPFRFVVLTSPQSVEKLLSSNDDGHLVKSDEYSVLGDYFDEGLVTSCGNKWRSRRKLFNPLLNYKCFPHFLEVFNRHSKSLMQHLDILFCDSGDVASPIHVPLYESLLKIICETTMGVKLNDSSEEFDKFFEEAERSKEFIFRRISRPWYRVDWIWKIHPFRRVYEENMKYIKDYIMKVIQEARRKYLEETETGTSKHKQRNKTVMEVMLENAMSNSDIREEAHTLISAGHETSGSALQFTLMLLALNPEHQVRCQDEIDDIINDESKCPNGDFTLISLADLKHTERCIKESLRLYPIGNLFARKLKTPLRLDENVVLPEGITCVIAASNIHRNPEIYPEPEKFDPSRFTPENCTARHPYAYFPFSAGPRNCIGQKFAMIQMKLILGRILHHFTVETTDKLEDVPLDASCVLTPVRGYNFIFRKRKPIPTYKTGEN